MALMADYLEEEIPRLLANGVRLSVIGRRDRLPPRLLACDCCGRSRHQCRKQACVFSLAIDYSAREAILRAAERAIAGPVTLE